MDLAKRHGGFYECILLAFFAAGLWGCRADNWLLSLPALLVTYRFGTFLWHMFICLALLVSHEW